MQKDPAQMEQKRAEHLKKMQADLGLSDAQVAQVKALQDKRMAERKAQAPQIPVSYTHLDVYKRQIINILITIHGTEFMACLLYTSRCV